MRNAEHLLYRQASEAQRREKWLSQQVGDPEHRQEAVPASTADRYGLDLEEFKGKTGHSSMRFHINVFCELPFCTCVILARSPPKGLEQVRADRGMGLH